ncbi:hypothetical protein [Kribbella sp. NPDC006257]|uniref:hypothetical protein n=1 Tax=Kribbella sp. NPDC006257 TaxID=3156738 RepID=UPI0033A640D1
MSIPGNPFDPYLRGKAMDPDGHAARHGVTCRNCSSRWPCANSTRTDHTPSPIPTGATVTTYEDVDRLAWDHAMPVVLDRDHTPWMLFIDEDGDGYAGTIPCPDEGIPPLYDLQDLPARGPLYVLFNGDPTTLAASNDATREDR